METPNEVNRHGHATKRRRFAAYVARRSSPTLGITNMHHRIALLLLASTLPIAAHSADVDRFCIRTAQSIDTLASTFRTTCLPTSGQRPGFNSALFIANAPIFSAEKSKKAFLIVACIAAGGEMNKTAGYKMSELWFTDVENAKREVAFSIPATDCKTMQSQVHAGNLSLEDMYGRLNTKLTQRTKAK